MPDAREPDYPVWRYPTNPPRPRKIPYPGPDIYDAYQHRSQCYRDVSNHSGNSESDPWGGSTEIDSSEGSEAAYENDYCGRHDRHGSSDGYGSSSRDSRYDSDEESYYPIRRRQEQHGFDSESSTSSCSSPSRMRKNDLGSSDASSSSGYGNTYGEVRTPKHENGSIAGGTPCPSSTTGSSDGEYSAAQSDHSYTYPARMYRDGGRRVREPQSPLAGRGRAEYARGTRGHNFNGDRWSEEDDEYDD